MTVEVNDGGGGQVCNIDDMPFCRDNFPFDSV